MEMERKDWRYKSYLAAERQTTLSVFNGEASEGQVQAHY